MGRKKSDAVDIAFRYIRNQITQYELKPGDIVSDSAISQELSLSRTPVREAMAQLENRGLIERSGSRFVVTHITISNIIDVFEVRAAIEVMAIKKIIENGGLKDSDKKDLELIQADFRTAVESHSIQRTFKPDAEFHMKIAEISGNEAAFNITKDLEFMSERIRWLSMLTPQRYEVSFGEHENILKGLLTLNEKFAIKSSEAHIKNSLNNYRKVSEISNWEDIIITIYQSIRSSAY